MAGTQLIVPLAPIDSAQFARSVREDTAELASYVLSDKKDKRSASFLTHKPSFSSPREPEPIASHDGTDYIGDSPASEAETIEEVSEPPSPASTIDLSTAAGPSVLSSMLRHSPPQPLEEQAISNGGSQDANWQMSTRTPDRSSLHDDALFSDNDIPSGPSETTPLLNPKLSQPGSPSTASEFGDIEAQKPKKPNTRSFLNRYLVPHGDKGANKLHRFANGLKPKNWDRRVIWQHTVVEPVRCLPSVIVGLLLNILDALSYGTYHTQLISSSCQAYITTGMILFPLGNPIFSNLGPAGISIFYVSTIISQLTFSFGSIFRGGVGSELVCALCNPWCCCQLTVA